MSFLRQATKRLLTACVPPRWLLTRGPRHAPNEQPRLALTFDDGPHPIHTARLLDVLRAARLSATFFVVGRDAAILCPVIQAVRFLSEDVLVGLKGGMAGLGVDELYDMLFNLCRPL